MIPTKEQIDTIFHSLADESVASDINRQAKEMFAVAEKSEHFRAVVTQFIQASMQSLSLGGFVPKGPAMAVCVAFLLGQRSVQGELGLPAASAAEPSVDPTYLDQWMKELDEKWKDEQGGKP